MPNRKEYMRRYIRKFKRDVLLAYGGKCVCCGYSDLEKKILGKSFLQIDHVNDSGGWRKRHKEGSYGFYLRLKRENFPPGYRVLCAGCNASIEPGTEKCELHKQPQTSQD